MRRRGAIGIAPKSVIYCAAAFNGQVVVVRNAAEIFRALRFVGKAASGKVVAAGYADFVARGFSGGAVCAEVSVGPDGCAAAVRPGCGCGEQGGKRGDG